MFKDNGFPKLEEIIGGWAAYGKGWAVHAATKQEALNKYQERKAFYEHLATLPPFRDRIDHEMRADAKAH